MLLNRGPGEDSWESLDSKEIKPANPKGNKPWIFIGRTDSETEAPILWPPDAKSRLIGKGPDAGNNWEQENKGATEDEMVRWHHRLNGYEFEQTPGEGTLECCSPWGHKSWTSLSDWRTTLCNFIRNIFPHTSVRFRISDVVFFRQ